MRALLILAISLGAYQCTPVYAAKSAGEHATIKTAKPPMKAASRKVAFRPVSVSEARTAYDRGDYKRAIELYESMSPEQAEYLRTREELAWSYLMAGRLNSLRGMLPHLNSQLVPLRYRLEGRVLSSMMYLRDCQYRSVNGEIQKFQNELSGLVKQVDKGVARSKNPAYYGALSNEIEEAILKMKFVKMELRSRLVMLSRTQISQPPQEPAPASERITAGMQTYPVNGDIWVDEIFQARGESASLCQRLHKERQ